MVLSEFSLLSEDRECFVLKLRTVNLTVVIFATMLFAEAAECLTAPETIVRRKLYIFKTYNTLLGVDLMRYHNCFATISLGFTETDAHKCLAIRRRRTLLLLSPAACCFFWLVAAPHNRNFQTSWFNLNSIYFNFCRRNSKRSFFSSR